MGQAGNQSLRVYLLGHFEVRVGERVILDSSWPRSKAKALVKLLALQPNRSLHREQVLDLLWPELDPVAAANNLRKNLHYLRSALTDAGCEASLVSVQRDIVALDIVGADIDTFRELAAAARGSSGLEAYEQALALYEGDLLPEDLYEEWTRQPREDLRALRQRLLLDLSALYLSQGAGDRAVARAQQAVAADAYDEEALRALMRAFAASGEHARALLRYREYRDVAKREHGSGPTKETSALYQEVANSQTVAPVSTKIEASAIPGGDADLPLPKPATDGRKRRLPVLAAAALVLGLTGVATAGVLFLGGVVGGDGAFSSESAYRQFNTHVSNLAISAPIVTGDCQSSDLTLKGQYSSDITGDISGQEAGSIEVVFYASEGCDWGFSTTTYTTTDRAGNALFGVEDDVLFMDLPSSGQGPSVDAAGSPGPFIYTEGTGIYQGAVGHGRCAGAFATTAVGGSATAPEGVQAGGEGECLGKLAVGIAAAQLPPVVLDIGSGVVRMGAFTNSTDLPKKAYFNVLYFNPHDEPQRGLALRLPMPDGAEIIAAERNEKRQPQAGERVWSLPDLQPGELGRFQFSVQFLSAETEMIDLVTEIDGDGFDRPVRSDPLQIEVVP